MCARLHVCVCAHVHVCVCVCVHACMCVCVHTCVLIVMLILHYHCVLLLVYFVPECSVVLHIWTDHTPLH